MDVWIVAAAAGAGYMAQHWKNLLRGRQDFTNSTTENPNFLLSESSPKRQQVQEKDCPLRRVMSGKKVDKYIYSDRDLSSHDATAMQEASTSGYDGDNMALLGTSTSGLALGNINDDLLGGQERVRDDIYENNGGLPLHPSKEELVFSCSPAKRKRPLRAWQMKGQVIKPLNSLESCLMAQLYKENAEIQEFDFSSVNSPRKPTTRPFLVTDGSRIINRASDDSFDLPLGAMEKQPHKNTHSQQETICGFPQLPKIEYMNLQQRAKYKSGLKQVERSNSSSRISYGKHQNLQGSSHGAFLFCLGISVGVLSSFLSNQREVDKLNKLLKQTENLVQDLHEELEMKDSLTVKELAVEGYESQDTHNDSLYDGHACSPEHKLDDSMEHCDSICHDDGSEEKSLSKIEAELEAELERLELNMTASSLEGKLSDLIELDPDFAPAVAVGEFRADARGRQAGKQPYVDRDGSGSSTTHSANYAVSPRALSLRLHEVIQSRLEERVKELETALQNSQKKVQYMDYDINPWRNLSSSEAGSSSAQGSPLSRNERSRAEHPVVINLSGDALDAYHEAYDLFTKINDSEEEKPCGFYNSSRENSSRPCSQSQSQVQNGCHESINGQASVTLPTDTGTSGDESDDNHDEMEKLLIQHIVEKARKGSPVVLNAQKALFSKDENEL